MAATSNNTAHHDLRNDIDNLAKSKESQQNREESKETIQINFASQSGERSMYVVATEEEESHETQTITTDFSPEGPQQQQPLPTKPDSVFSRLDKSLDRADQEVQEIKPIDQQPQPRRNRSKSPERNNRRGPGAPQDRRSSRESDRPFRRDFDRRRSLDRESRFRGGHERLRGRGRGRGRGNCRDFPYRDDRRAPRYESERLDDRRRSSDGRRREPKRQADRSDDGSQLSQEERPRTSKESKPPANVVSEARQQKEIHQTSENETSGSIESASINLVLHGRELDNSSSLDESSSHSSQWKPTPSTKFLNMTPSINIEETVVSPSNKKEKPAKENVIVIESPSPKLPTPTQQEPEPPFCEENISQPSSRKSSTKEGDQETKVLKDSTLNEIQNSEKEKEEGTEESEQEDDGESSNSSDSSTSHTKKKSSKRERKKKQRKRRKSDSTDESSSDEESEDEESSSDSEYEKRRKKSKKKKRRKDKKSIKRKRKNKRKTEKGKVISNKEFAKLKEKMRKEIMEEIKESLPVVASATTTTSVAAKPTVSQSKTPVVETTPQAEKAKEEDAKQSSKESTSEGDDLELDYSSEEPYDEHGFHTGVSQKKDSPEPTLELNDKDVEKKENVFDVTEDVVDDLDYDLDDSAAEEENWKRQKKDGEGDDHKKTDRTTSSRNDRRHIDRRERRRDDKQERRRSRDDSRRHREDDRRLGSRRDKKRDDAYDKHTLRRTDDRRDTTERRHHNENKTSTQHDDRQRKKESTTTKTRKEDAPKSKSRSREGSANETKSTKSRTSSNKNEEERKTKLSEEPQVKPSSTIKKQLSEDDANKQVSRTKLDTTSQSSSKHPKGNETSTTNEAKPSSTNTIKASTSFKPRPLRSDLYHQQQESPSSVSTTSFRTVDEAIISPDGIAIANEIRHSVLKRDTFWKGSSSENQFDPQQNALERAEQQATDEKVHKNDLHHASHSRPSPPPASASGDIASIGHRLLKIADQGERTTTDGTRATTVEDCDQYHPASVDDRRQKEYRQSNNKQTLPPLKQQRSLNESREEVGYLTIRDEKRPHSDDRRRSTTETNNDSSRKRHDTTTCRPRDTERRRSRETEVNGRGGIGHDRSAPRRHESIMEDRELAISRMSYKHNERERTDKNSSKRDLKDDRREPRGRDHKDRKSTDERHNSHRENRNDSKRSKLDPPPPKPPLPAAASYNPDSPGRLDIEGNAENFTRPKKHYRTVRR